MESGFINLGLLIDRQWGRMWAWDQLSLIRKASFFFPLIPVCISASYYTETEKADRWAPRGQQIKLNLSQAYTWPSGRDAEIQSAAKRKSSETKEMTVWQEYKKANHSAFDLSSQRLLQKTTLGWINSFLTKQRLECLTISIFEYILQAFFMVERYG